MLCPSAVGKNWPYAHQSISQQTGTNSSRAPDYTAGVKHYRMACFPMFTVSLCYSKSVIWWQDERIFSLYFSEHNCAKEVKYI